MSTTYRQHFELAEGDFFIKNSFEVKKNCNNRFSSNNTSMISRLINTIIFMVNSKNYLPDFLIIVLDDDLIEFLNYFNSGISMMYGQWLEYLAKEINVVLNSKWEKLPKKCRGDYLPQVYWVSCPGHKNFAHSHLHEKFNITLQMVMKSQTSMRVVKFKDHWSVTDQSLVVNNRFTTEEK